LSWGPSIGREKGEQIQGKGDTNTVSRSNGAAGRGVEGSTRSWGQTLFWECWLALSWRRGLSSKKG